MSPLRLHGIRTGCIRCGEEARWIVVDLPLCDRCRDRPQGACEDETREDACPMGCGATTEDVYGGPCTACWKQAGERA